MFERMLQILAISLMPYAAYAEPRGGGVEEPPTIYVDNGFYEYRSISGITPLSVSLVEAEDNWVNVVFHNELVAMSSPSEIHFAFEDEVIMVFLTHEPGDAPDIMEVVPPDGYIAIPGQVSVDEMESGTIEIHRALLM